MTPYLQTMNVPDMAIQAHEKGELETDTYHTITLTDKHVKIVKRSRVNDDVVVELELGNEKTEMLRAWSTDRSIKNPENRPKTALATTEDPGKHLRIENSLVTVNGLARVVDTKRLVQEEVKIDDAGSGETNDDTVTVDDIGDTTTRCKTRSVLIQELVITNDVTGATNTTTRYFLPYNGKLEGEYESPAYALGGTTLTMKQNDMETE